MPNKINPQKRSADLISSDVSSVASEEALDTGPDQDRARDASKRELLKRKFFCRIDNRVGIPLHDYFSCHPELAKVLDFRDQLPEKQKNSGLVGLAAITTCHL